MGEGGEGAGAAIEWDSMEVISLYFGFIGRKRLRLNEESAKSNEEETSQTTKQPFQQNYNNAPNSSQK